jgi:hypothetical protein
LQCKYRHAARTLDQDRVFCRAHHSRRKAAQAGLMPTSGADANARVINRGAMAMCAMTSSCNVAMEQEWGQERVISARSDGACASTFSASHSSLLRSIPLKERYAARNRRSHLEFPSQRIDRGPSAPRQPKPSDTAAGSCSSSAMRWSGSHEQRNLLSFPPFPAEDLGRHPAQGRDGVPLCGWSNDPVASGGRKTLPRGGGSPTVKVVDLKGRLRCRGCGRKGPHVWAAPLYYSEVLCSEQLTTGSSRLSGQCLDDSIAFCQRKS